MNKYYVYGGNSSYLIKDLLKERGNWEDVEDKYKATKVSNFIWKPTNFSDIVRLPDPAIHDGERQDHQQEDPLHHQPPAGQQVHHHEDGHPAKPRHALQTERSLLYGCLTQT